MVGSAERRRLPKRRRGAGSSDDGNDAVAKTNLADARARVSFHMGMSLEEVEQWRKCCGAGAERGVKVWVGECSPLNPGSVTALKLL